MKKMFYHINNHFITLCILNNKPEKKKHKLQKIDAFVRFLDF